jgi:hypothetical protein
MPTQRVLVALVVVVVRALLEVLVIPLQLLPLKETTEQADLLSIYLVAVAVEQVRLLLA